MVNHLNLKSLFDFLLKNYSCVYLKGKCNYTLNCNVTDKVADEDNPLVVNDKSILDLPIKLNAEAISLNIIPTPKHSGGYYKKFLFFYF